MKLKLFMESKPSTIRVWRWLSGMLKKHPDLSIHALV